MPIGNADKTAPRRPSTAPDGDVAGRLATMFKALGHPVRFRIVRFVSQHPDCIVADIVDDADRAQSTVSRHLDVLCDAGWLLRQSDPPRTRYAVHDAAVDWFRANVGRIL